MVRNKSTKVNTKITAKGNRSVSANNIHESFINTGDINIFNPRQSSDLVDHSNVKSIFIHYFNDQMLNNYSLTSKYDAASLAPTFVHATRIAFLLTDNKIIIPTIDTAQSEYFKLAYHGIKGLLDTQTIFFAGSEISPAMWRLHKIKHFRAVKLYPQYFDEDLDEFLSHTSPYWIKRTSSTTQDISNRWMAAVLQMEERRTLTYDGKRLLSAYNHVQDSIKLAKYINELFRVPQRLDGQAFLWDVIRAQRIVSFGAQQQVTYPIELALGFMWISSHLEEYDAAIFSYLPKLGAFDCGISDEYPHASYRFSVFAQLLNMYGLLKLIVLIDNDSLILLKTLESFRIFKRKLFIPKYRSIVFNSDDAQHLNLIERRLIEVSRRVLDKTKLRSGSKSSALGCIINIVESLSDVICKLDPSKN